MIVLSLFDGIAAGFLALKRANIQVTKYYASEIDKYAIKIANKNFPNIIQLGDINNWKNWEIDKPDLIIGGSPCQGFSFAGKQLAFEDPRSKLFFVFIEILKFYKPKYFLLENVRMKKEFLEIISNEMGVNPILINSSLVSAQQRKRYYWTNIPNVTQPNDKKIYLKDILENGVCDKNKSYCIDANYYKNTNLNIYSNQSKKQIVFDKPIRIGDFGKKCQSQIIYSIDGKSVALCALGGGGGAKTGLYQINFVIRKLTPVECERLQTFPDNYTEGVSNTQRYKMLGNAWTVDIIAHIFYNINEHNKER